MTLLAKIKQARQLLKEAADEASVLRHLPRKDSSARALMECIDATDDARIAADRLSKTLLEIQ